MYDVRPNLIFGFHGCDAHVRDSLVNNPNEIVVSKEPYDWLGHGMYFWENNYVRALQWAEDKKKRGKIQTPAVIGAVLYLGYCCDFLDAKFIGTVESYYKKMVQVYETAEMPLPKNQDLAQDQHKDKILRALDCAAIEFMHGKLSAKIDMEVDKKRFSNLKIFDSTRGAFTEGGPAFEGSGLYAKTHIQICIRNPDCIKAFFIPRKEKTLMPALESVS
jgi:hypothetical protein